MPFRFSDQNSGQISHFPMQAACPAYLILLDLMIEYKNEVPHYAVYPDLLSLPPT
jgi:hypothetical protein